MQVVDFFPAKGHDITLTVATAGEIESEKIGTLLNSEA